jgi:hypothetical protein
MAGKTIVPFVGSESMYGHNGEPSPANQALASPVVEEEARHIATTPLVILPAPRRKMAPRGTDEGAANPLVRPNRGGGPSASLFGTAHHQEGLCLERQGRTPGNYVKANDG